jgi:4-amino-4-deoxy-L-arabinose transferase-like glycosyltransferase
MFASGRVSFPPPVALPVPWPNAAATFIPSGFTPATDGSPNMVPLCPAGLSLLMAGAIKAGGDGAWFWVVPLLGAVAVWSTYLLGWQMTDRRVGAAAAVLLACSPIFLFQLFQPMSDVPAAALWTASLVLAVHGSRRQSVVPRPVAGVESCPPCAPAAQHTHQAITSALVSGLLAGAAILVRPNLAPLAVVPVLMAWPSWRAAVATIAGIVPGGAAVAILQFLIYGSALRSSA